VNAEAFINKASFLVTNSHHEVLNLQYKVCYFGYRGTSFYFILGKSLILHYIFSFQGLLCKDFGSEKKISGSCTSIL
jgi:hypothetical protein